MMGVRTRATLLGAATLLAGVAVWLSPAAGHAAALTIQEYPLLSASSQPRGIISGPDGKLWVAESGSNKVASVTTVGVVKEFDVPSLIRTFGPTDVAVEGTRYIWFTEFGRHKVGRLNIAVATAKDYTAPTPDADPWEFAAGPDGAMWFTEFGGTDQIGLARSPSM